MKHLTLNCGAGNIYETLIVPLSRCCMATDDGNVISKIVVNGNVYIYVIDKDGRSLNIADWQATSFAEFELQAMLNGCLSGLSDAEEAMTKKLATSLLAKQLAQAKADLAKMQSSYDNLLQTNTRRTNAIVSMSERLKDVIDEHWFTDDPKDPESWGSLMEDVGKLAGMKWEDRKHEWLQDMCHAKPGSRKKDDVKITTQVIFPPKSTSSDLN